MEFEFLHDVHAVSGDGIDAAVEGGGDLLVGVAFGEELEDLFFPIGQEVVGVLEAAAAEFPEVVIGKGGADVGAEEVAAGGDGADGRGEIGTSSGV